MWPAQFADGPGLRSPSFPAPPGSPSALYFGENIDGSSNATLSNGVSFATWKNLGSLTSGDLVQATGANKPTYTTGARNCASFGASAFMQAAAWSATLTQPTLIALMFKLNTAGAGTFQVCDGTGFGHRNAIDDNSLVQIQAGTLVNGPISTTRAQYNIIVAYYNGASSTLELNRGALTGITGNNIGAGDLPGFTIMANFLGTSPGVGDFVTGAVWNGAGLPAFSTVGGWDVVYDWFEAIYNVGWPKTALTAIATPPAGSFPNVALVGGSAIAMAGDSITATPRFWYEIPTTGLMAKMNAAVVTPFVFSNFGVGGNTIAQLNARVGAIVTAAPACVITEIGVNDCPGSATTGGTPLDSYQTSYMAYCTALKNAGIKIVNLSILCHGEYYPDPLNAVVNQYNSIGAAATAAAGGTWVDVRTPQQAFEAANNTPPPGLNFGPALLTTDGVHTGLVSGGDNPNGAVLMGTAVMSKLTFSG